MEFELDFIIPCRSMINGLFKADERVYHFARQNEADPHTNTRERATQCSSATQHDESVGGFLVIQLDAPQLRFSSSDASLQGPFTDAEGPGRLGVTRGFLPE